ncbi:MAG: hypothetical protein ACRC62_24415 [Microcoleus sp.]
MGNGNGEWGMGNGEWGMGNGEWRMGNGEWGMGNGELVIGNSLLNQGLARSTLEITDIQAVTCSLLPVIKNLDSIRVSNCTVGFIVKLN